MCYLRLHFLLQSNHVTHRPTSRYTISYTYPFNVEWCEQANCFQPRFISSSLLLTSNSILVDQCEQGFYVDHPVISDSVSVGFCNFPSGLASDRPIALTQVLYFTLFLGKCQRALTAKSVNRTGI